MYLWSAQEGADDLDLLFTGIGQGSPRLSSQGDELPAAAAEIDI